MSLTEDDRVGHAASVDAAPASAPTHALPQGLTETACEAFGDVKDEFHAGMSEELRRRRRIRRDLTPDDVYAARAVVAQAMCGSQAREPNGPGTADAAAAARRRRAKSRRDLGTGLIAIGSVGVGSMHPYLHSWWQVALLAACVLLLLAGVGLVWRGGRDAEGNTGHGRGETP